MVESLFSGGLACIRWENAIEFAIEFGVRRQQGSVLLPFQYQEQYHCGVTLHYIIKLFIVAKVKNCKVHYGASHPTMSGCDCQNKCVF